MEVNKSIKDFSLTARKRLFVRRRRRCGF